MSSYLNPKLQSYFEMLPIVIKNDILESEVTINTLEDLINCINKSLYGAEG